MHHGSSSIIWVAILVVPLHLAALNSAHSASSKNSSGHGLDPSGSAPLDADDAHIKSLRDAACSALERLTKRKDSVQQRLRAAAASLVDTAGAAGHLQTRGDIDGLLESFHARLDRCERLIYLAIGWLEEALQGKSKSIAVMQAVVESRLRALREATFEEEQEYEQLIHLVQRERMHLNHTRAGSLAERVLREVAEAADDIEDNLERRLVPFTFLTSSVSQSKQANTENIRAVLVMNNVGNTKQGSKSHVVRMVDSTGNQFSLTRPHDLTTSGEDSALLSDLIYLLVVSASFGFTCSLLHIPHVFGYVLAGVVLGPSVADLLTSLVQIETLGELGAFMIMFSAGLDFSPEKISQVSRVAVPTSLSLTIITVLCGVTFGNLISSANLAESTFIAICLSMTSTPLVVRFMSGSRSAEHLMTVSSAHDTTGIGPRHYGPTLAGILVLQDAVMGFVIGFLPSFASEGDDNTSAIFKLSVVLFEFGLFILAVVFVSVVARRLHVSYARHLSTESAVLVTSGLPFAVLLVTHSLDLSMELGCFLAGVAVNFIDTTLGANMDRLLLPVKNTLSSLFFVTAGLRVFPSFVFIELTVLVIVTLLIIFCKFSAAAFVLHTWLPASLRPSKFVMAAGLAQGSEFSFVLSSRARRLQLISREVYLLVTSTSTLTLLLAPIAWHIAAWQFSRKRPSEGSGRGLDTDTLCS